MSERFNSSAFNALTQPEIKAYCAARLKGAKLSGGEFRAPCPIHGGERDSFAINAETGQWYCHSECGRGGDIPSLEMALSGTDYPTAYAEICRITGRNDGTRVRTRSQIVDTYDYTDGTGTLLFQAVRFEPKKFAFRRRNETGDWTGDLAGVKKVLFKLNEVLRRKTELLCICEGEKDVLALNSLGFLATCNPGGAKKGRRDSFETIGERSVVFFPDNDIPGYEHVAKIIPDLISLGCNVRVVEVQSVRMSRTGLLQAQQLKR